MMQGAAVQGLTLAEISHVIALATAPSFLLGAVVAFVSLLLVRAGRIFDVLKVLDETDTSHPRHKQVRRDLPLLRRRARMIHVAIAISVLSGAATALLVVIAFLGALLNVNLEAAVAVLFVLSLLLFVVALYLFAHEALLELGEFNRLS
jgi:hypothetical protein